MKEKKGDTLSSSAIKTGLGNFGSRVTGLFRDILFASYFGTSGTMSAFLAALTLPNLSRRIFGEGALTASFIPLLSDKLKNEDDTWKFASLILSITVVLTTILALAGITTCLLMTYFVSPDKQLLFKLCAWTLPYMVFICLSALISGILNLLKSFSLPALSSMIFNVALIITCLFTSTTNMSIEAKITSLTFAVLISGFLYRALKQHGARLKWNPDFKSSDWLKVKKLFLPGILGASVAQLSVLSDRIIAIGIGDHAVSALYYSERLTYFPVGIFGVALGVACLPYMSKAVSQGNDQDLMHAFSFGFRQTIFLTIPCTFIFYHYHTDIMTIIFKRGAFDNDSLKQSALALSYYLPGIPAFAATKIILPLYFAKKNTKTPVKIAIFSLSLNLILGLSLIPWLQHASLALATTVTCYANIILLLYHCGHKDMGHTLSTTITPLARIVICMFISCALINQFNWLEVQQASLYNFAILACKIGCCSSLFILLHTLSGGRELHELLKRKIHT
jgi:putative peptidoglycan lipid II flippase